MYDFNRLHFEFAGKQRSELTTPGLPRAYKYLADRGILAEDIDRLGIVIAPAREVIARVRGVESLSLDSRLAIIFGHVWGDGKPMDWWSARLVDTDERPVVARGFQELIAHKARAKMYCPPMEPPCAYLVPTMDWSLLKRGDYVFIHESCIKAINGAALGYWSIGLNGVRGWSARKHGLALVDGLKSIPWKSLELIPVIVFDSNVVDNWDVRTAMLGLAAKLYELTGRRARHLDLPKNGEEHWGFDDYCVKLGREAAEAYLNQAGDSPEIELSELELKKLELNSRVCVVRSIGKIVEQDTGTVMSRQMFTDVNYSHWLAQEPASEDGPGKMLSVSRAWLVDERRVEVEKLEYSPGSAELVPGEFLNLWRGMGAEPEAGDVSAWLELLEKQVPDAGLRRWVIQWMAYPLQNLGEKLNTYLYLYGPPGSGKNALLVPLVGMYGVNAVTIGKDQIASTFNSVYATRQMVVLDEIHGGNEQGAVSITNRIKMLTTSPELTVNTKGVPEYTVRNHANLVAVSNYSDSIKLDEGDRRACVVRFGGLLGEAFWNRYFAWAESEAGAGALYSYLLGVDLSGFDPAGHAPMTEWKEVVTDATRGAMEKWVRDLWDDPDSVLPAIMSGAKVLTPEQLGAAYYPGESGKNTPGLRNALGQRMNDQGFKRTGQVKIDGVPKRFWVIRDRESDWTNDAVRGAYSLKKSKF